MFLLVVDGSRLWKSIRNSDLVNVKSIRGLCTTYCEIPQNVYYTLKNTAITFPDKIALVEEGRTITYKALKDKADKLAAILCKNYLIKKGDKVAFLMVNSIDFCIAFYAVAKIGGIVVPLNTKQKERELLIPQ